MALLDTEGLVGLVLFVFWIWAIIDVIATDDSLIRNLPKLLWLLLVIVLPLIGAVCWLLLGRPQGAGFWPGGGGGAGHEPGYRGSAPHWPRRDAPPQYLGEYYLTDRRSAELDARLDRELASRDRQRAIEPPRDDHDRELAAWEADLQRREQELRRRELEAKERDLARREHDLGPDAV